MGVSKGVYWMGNTPFLQLFSNFYRQKDWLHLTCLFLYPDDAAFTQIVTNTTYETLRL